MSRSGWTVTAVAGALVLAACGGGSDGSGDEAADDPQTADVASNGAGDGGDVPDGLPPDFYLPAEVEPGPVIASDSAIAMSAPIDPDEAERVLDDMVVGLQANGYELLSNDDIAVFAKDGVGRVRVRVANVLGDTSLSVDIDRWTDEQLDELRSLVAEPVSASASAVAVVGGATHEAVGECVLQGDMRSFSSEDASVTVQIDETQDPPYVYADVTTPDGVVFGTEFGAPLEYTASDAELSVSGEMTNYTDEAATPAEFTITASCDS